LLRWIQVSFWDIASETFMKTLPLADIRTIEPVVDFLHKGGASVLPLLDSLDISYELLRKGTSKITKRQVYGFLVAAIKSEGIPDLGFRFGENYLLKMGDMSEALSKTVTLYDAIQTFGRLLECWMSDNKVWIEFEGADAWICNATFDGFQLQRDASNHNCVIVLSDLVKLATDDDWRPTHVKIEANSSEVHEKIEMLSDAVVEYNPDKTGVKFPVKWLSRPIKLMPDATYVHSHQMYENPKNYVDALTIFLQSHVDSGIILSSSNAADAIGVNRRTLHRQLQKEGLNFRHLIDRIKFNRAKTLLHDSTISIKDISSELGYSGTNNFARAFKRISSITPTHYRLLVIKEAGRYL